MKVLFSSFLRNGHTAWFDPQTEKLEPHCITKQTASHESTVFRSFAKTGRNVWFDPQTKMLEPHKNHTHKKKKQHNVEVLSRRFEQKGAVGMHINARHGKILSIPNDEV